jgi:hypothetical protein
VVSEDVVATKIFTGLKLVRATTPVVGGRTAVAEARSGLNCIFLLTLYAICMGHKLPRNFPKICPAETTSVYAAVSGRKT